MKKFGSKNKETTREILDIITEDVLDIREDLMALSYLLSKKRYWKDKKKEAKINDGIYKGSNYA